LCTRIKGLPNLAAQQEGRTRVRSEPYSPECVERLSEKSLESSLRFMEAALKVAKCCFWARFDRS
jgi:hypothetical protein